MPEIFYQHTFALQADATNECGYFPLAPDETYTAIDIRCDGGADCPEIVIQRARIDEVVLTGDEAAKFLAAGHGNIEELFEKPGGRTRAA
jgi:hypothetical protein